MLAFEGRGLWIAHASEHRQRRCSFGIAVSLEEASSVQRLPMEELAAIMRWLTDTLESFFGAMEHMCSSR